MTGSSKAKKLLTRRLLAMLALVALIGASCGDDDSDTDSASDSSSASSSETDSSSDSASDSDSAPAEADAEPIKVMTVTTLNAAGPTYQNIANTAELYADFINARGGIAGRPLEVTVCDEQFDPAVAATCARGR